MPGGYLHIEKPFPKEKPLPDYIKHFALPESFKSLERVIIIEPEIEETGYNIEEITSFKAYRFKKGVFADYIDFSIRNLQTEGVIPVKIYEKNEAVQFIIDFVWADEYLEPCESANILSAYTINDPVIISHNPMKDFAAIQQLFYETNTPYHGETSFMPNLFGTGKVCVSYGNFAFIDTHLLQKQHFILKDSVRKIFKKYDSAIDYNSLLFGSFAVLKALGTKSEKEQGDILKLDWLYSVKYLYSRIEQYNLALNSLGIHEYETIDSEFLKFLPKSRFLVLQGSRNEEEPFWLPKYGGIKKEWFDSKNDSLKINQENKKCEHR